MKPDLYWIPGIKHGRLAIMPRPRAGDWLDDELKAWKLAGIDVVVSLLTPFEEMELGLQSEAQGCRDCGIDFVSYPIPDRQVPASISTAVTLIKDIDLWLNAGKSVAIHCRAGIGRSAMIAACAMVVQGTPPDSAFDAIKSARGVEVPDTDDQRRWVEGMLRQFSSQP
jgi:protein-tyrosine phosphatase